MVFEPEPSLLEKLYDFLWTKGAIDPLLKGIVLGALVVFLTRRCSTADRRSTTESRTFEPRLQREPETETDQPPLA